MYFLQASDSSSVQTEAPHGDASIEYLPLLMWLTQALQAQSVVAIGLANGVRATAFADGSIDLLHMHVDSAPTPPSRLIDAWMPKLSGRAWLAVHGLSPQASRARPWSKLIRRFPHISLAHGQGLTLLAIGKEQPPRLGGLLSLRWDDRATAIATFQRAGAAALLNSSGALAQAQGALTHSQEELAALGTALDGLGQMNEANSSTLANRLPRLLRLARGFLALRLSKLFDADWYLDTYPDLRERRVNPLLHYYFEGAFEGRNPNAFFDSRAYLRSNPDVRASGANPLLHYVQAGAREGRNPSARFDTLWYLGKYPDVAHRGTNPLKHFLRHGQREGRAALPGEQNGERSGATERLAPRFKREPLVSVVMPVFNVAADLLTQAIDSVRKQSYPHWEICICDDKSTNPETILALLAATEETPNLKVKWASTNAGISGATNAALSLATGEFVAFLDNDDVLHPGALERCIEALERDPDIDVIYTDSDKIDLHGSHDEPFHKPDWSPAMLREVRYVGHLLVVRRSLAVESGGFLSQYDGVQDYEFMLRLSERTRKIQHIREILYHWRRIPGSVADKPDVKSDIEIKMASAVNAHLQRLGVPATARPQPDHPHRAIVAPLPRPPIVRVSIVIPTKDAGELISRCLDSIYGKTSYGNFEVVIVDNGTTDELALRAFERHPIRRIGFNEPFNYSRANNLGVEHATGEVLVLLNNDTEVIEADWLEQLLFLLDEPDVAAVGPMLLYGDGTVQHAGVALGPRGTADHVLRGLSADADGDFGRLCCTREVSAVTFACAMVRKSDYLAVGGLEELYRTHYQDVDFCLRLRQFTGGRILYTPRTRLFHHESATRGTYYDLLDRALLVDAWGHEISAGDPYSRWEDATRHPEMDV